MVSIKEKSGEDENFFNDTGESKLMEETNIDNKSRTIDKQDGKVLSYAKASSNNQLLSIDFERIDEIRGSVWKIFLFIKTMYAIEDSEVMGVHRYSFGRNGGYIKLKMKEGVNVSERFCETGPNRENDTFKTSLRGFKKKEDTIRILSPNESLSLNDIKDHLVSHGKLLSNLSEEKFSKDVPLVGSKPNGNYRAIIYPDNNLKEGMNVIEIKGHTIRIVKISGIQKCFKCFESGHIASKCAFNSTNNNKGEDSEPKNGNSQKS